MKDTLNNESQWTPPLLRSSTSFFSLVVLFLYILCSSSDFGLLSLGCWRRCFPRRDGTEEGNKGDICNLHNGKNGRDMGERLQRIQTREVAERWAVHEWTRIPLHGLQRRTSALLRQRFCLLSDEIRGCIYPLPIPCQGSGRPSGYAQNGSYYVPQVWTTSQALQASYISTSEQQILLITSSSCVMFVLSFLYFPLSFFFFLYFSLI